MNKDRAAIIVKLQKLFALSHSGNQHEAELALAKANAIMEEHQLTSNDIDLNEVGNECMKEDYLVHGMTNASKFLAFLVTATSKLYDCRGLLITYSGRGRMPHTTLRFIGFPMDVAASKMTFEHLLNSWKSIVEHDLKQARAMGNTTDARAYKNSHGHGFASSINRRVTELVKQRQQTVKSATGRDLVVVKSEIISKMTGKTASISVSNSDVSAYKSGQDRGNVISLNGALETKQSTLSIMKVG